MTKDSGWIHVADAMPEDDCYCAVAGYLIDDEGRRHKVVDSAVYFANDGWQIGDPWISEVTYWMRLPPHPDA